MTTTTPTPDPAASGADSEFTEVPILAGFDHHEPIGVLRIRTAALPPAPTFCFALGFQTLEPWSSPGQVPSAVYTGAYKLQCVSIVQDARYVGYLKQVGAIAPDQDGGHTFTDAPSPEPAPATRHELAAILRVTPEALAALLQLPPGAYIDDVYALHDTPGVLELRVRGAGWPSRPGQLLERRGGMVTQHYADDGSVTKIVIDWGLPSGTTP